MGMVRSKYRGRGAQVRIDNKFTKLSCEIDEEEEYNPSPGTKVYIETPENIISINNSPDIPFRYSINPYQGCEHGCVYCYARNTHHYWGFGSGIDFETKIIAKPDAPALLEKKFLSKSWKPETIVLSGNTDCYQPVEKKLKITRQIFEIMAKYLHPVSIVTKNSLILRDIDILKFLAEKNLVRVIISITTINEEVRRILEPRTASVLKKLETIEKLNAAGIPAGVLIGPVIPGINYQEVPEILKKTSDVGAIFANYTMIRLNGDLGQIFKNWLAINFPDRVSKVWNQVCSLHGGKVSESVFGKRMRGEGPIADAFRQIFNIAYKKYFNDKKLPDLNKQSFRKSGNLNLFD